MSSYIARCTGYRSVGVEPSLHRGLPSPYVTAILTLEYPLTLGGYGMPSGEPRQFDALGGGMHTQPAIIVQPGQEAGIQLALTPLGSRTILGVPAGALAGIDAHLEDVVGTDVRHLRERLLESASWPEAFDLLSSWLTRRISLNERTGYGWCSELDKAWTMLVGSGGAARILSVASEVGWGARHLRERMSTEVGVTPKQAARLARFDRSRRELARRWSSGADLSLSELAAAHGYADQAHMTREFRDFAGLAPTAWLAEEHPFVQDEAVDAAS